MCTIGSFQKYDVYVMRFGENMLHILFKLRSGVCHKRTNEDDSAHLAATTWSQKCHHRKHLQVMFIVIYAMH